MNTLQNKNLCYVFSQATAELAIKEWLVSEIKNTPEKEQALNICAIALPWFLKHIQADATIYMFTENVLKDEIATWKNRQMVSYPNQTKRIEETCALIIAFFQSDTIKQHKMRIEVVA